MIFYSEKYGLLEIAFYDYDHFCIIISDKDKEYNMNFDVFNENFEFIGFI